jgi:hypothetical protein
LLGATVATVALWPRLESSWSRGNLEQAF